MREFSKKNFLHSEQERSALFIVLTCACGFVLTCINFFLSHNFLDTDPLVTALGTAFAAATIAFYEEICALLLIHRVRLGRLILASVIKITVLIFLLLVLPRSPGGTTVSALMGIFSFLPASILLGLWPGTTPTTQKRG